MAKQKREVTTMTFNKADIDPGVRAAFKDACARRDLSVGVVINDLMKEYVTRVYGPGAERVIQIENEIISRRLEKP